MTDSEKQEIALELQKVHIFFRAFWDIGDPVVEDFPDLSTAAIQFDKSGNAIKFLINKTFWESLNPQTRSFLVCHEMLHIILNHGIRFVNYIGTSKFSDMNIAADVVINELLCRSFGFNRDALDGKLSETGCWFDTVFPKEPGISKNESTEFYFDKIGKMPGIPQLYSIDSHDMIDTGEGDVQGALQSDGIFDLIDNDLKKKLEKCIETPEAGGGQGTWHVVSAKKQLKRKWETVVKKWESQFIKEEVDIVERWERNNPRYQYLMQPGTHLPMDQRVIRETKKKDRLDVYFFLDTSGSCFGLKNRFFSAAKSLNPKKFNIRLFCFDTRVVETDIKGDKIYGGGGTRFDIIETHIQNICKKENKKYPHAVWIITDGYGTNVIPEKPEKWQWFLTPNNSTKNIPKKSIIHQLSQFE